MTRKLLPLIKKIFKFAIKNYFITAFLAIIAFVGLVTVYKIAFSKPTYVYAKVKVGQGFWWATTAKPSIWMVNSIKKGEIEKSLTGTPNAQILSVRYYPTWQNNQFDIYLTLKLKVGVNNKTQGYTFKRSTLSVGAPIELQFPSTNVTGTVIEISRKPFKDRYVDKTVQIINQGGYNKDFPYRFDNIQIGDKYFDGEDYVFEVLDKKLEKNIWTIANALDARVYERVIESTQTIVVKAKIKVTERDGQLFFGEEYKVAMNYGIPFSTPNFFFEGFLVRGIK